MKLNQIIETIRTAIKTGFRRSMFIWGPPGIGKSEACHQAANLEGVGFVDFRLAQCDPSDVRGVLGLDLSKNKSTWYIPDILPTDVNSRGVLCIDELNLAPPSVQAAGYQLVLDRALGKYQVPPGWVIVACGNREEDRANVFDLPKPLENRFVHIDAEFDFSTWKDWAFAHDIDPAVVAFLNAKSELACKPPSDAERGFPTPRAWSACSDVLKSFGTMPEIRDELIAGAVGGGASTEFLAFVRLALTLLPLVEKIAAGENVEVKDLSKHFFVCGMLVEKYKESPKFSDRICSYASFSKGFCPESAVVMLMDAQSVDRAKKREGNLQSSKHWQGAISALAKFMV